MFPPDMEAREMI